MRLPVLPPSPPPPAEDLYEIRERPPVTPSRFVRARSLPPLIIPPKRRSARGPKQQAPAHEIETEAAAIAEDRRHGDRRASQQNVLLDTRTGADRRHHEEGDEPGGKGVDIEA